MGECHLFYLKQEAKKSFKEWTKDGLNHLLTYKDLPNEIKVKVEKRLKEIK
jgi:hypothetical protein